jgi:Na+-translocating ferredoxin:NAD+ oxidoreductase RnfG subunit
MLTLTFNNDSFSRQSSMRSFPTHRLSRILAAAVILAAGAAALPAYAAQYWTSGSVLGSFFATSKHVGNKAFTLSDADASAIAAKLGAPSVAKDWHIYIADTDGKRDGYAIVLDKTRGLHEDIDFAVQFDLGGAVKRVEIMEYREAYGEEIRSERFRKQFAGKTAKDAITAGTDIDIVSGASISSRSIALGVKRDALVLDAALKSGAL